MIDPLEEIAAQRVVPVIRTASAEDAVATARACARGGMRVIELTHSVPEVLAALQLLRDDDLVLGLGTVTSAGQVPQGVLAGARFVVSFTAPDGLIAAGERAGIPAIPGALTPTEVQACVQAGAPAVKLFPARHISPAYLSDLRAVMPDLRAMVTGGLRADVESLGPWLEAGAMAIGIGSDLGSVATHGEAEVERRARAALELAAGVAA